MELEMLIHSFTSFDLENTNSVRKPNISRLLKAVGPRCNKRKSPRKPKNSPRDVP